MFRFRSRRSQLVNRLAAGAGEAGDTEEEDGGRRRRLTNLLKRLELSQLEGLLVAVETGGQEAGDCWDCEESQHLTELGQLRWADLTSEDTLVRLPFCLSSSCSNPFHRSRLATPGIETFYGRDTVTLRDCDTLRHSDTVKL